MQYNAHKKGRAPVGPNIVCLCLHIKKGKDHFDTFNAHFIFAQLLINLHLLKKGTCCLIQQTDPFTMYFDWEVRRLGMRQRVKTRNHNGLRIWIFSQKMPFSVEKMFQRQIQEVQYTIPIRHITNISDLEVRLNDQDVFNQQFFKVLMYFWRLQL